MDLRQIRYFVTIVDELSISRAAARLHMTQPPLTSVVAALEKELGAELLTRHPKGVTPTEAGRHLASRGRRLLADAAAMTDAVRSLGQGATGVLSLAAVPSATWQLVPQLLRAYHSRFPHVHVTLDEVPGPLAAIEATRQRRVDAAILYTTDPEQLTSSYAEDLEAFLIRREPMVLLAPRSADRLPDADVLGIRDLADETWLTTSTPPTYPGLNQTLRAVWTEARIAPRVRELPSLGVARVFVQAGIGIAPATGSAIHDLPDTVRAIRVQERLPDLVAVAVRPKSIAMSSQLAQLLTLVETTSTHREQY